MRRASAAFVASLPIGRSATPVEIVLRHHGPIIVLEYEALLNHFYASNRALGLCQYNRSRLPAKILDTCMATHRHIRVEGPLLLENPFYELPEDAMTIPRDGEAIDEKLAQIDSMSAAS